MVWRLFGLEKPSVFSLGVDSPFIHFANEEAFALARKKNYKRKRVNSR
jgi:hypothetical protein